MKRSRPLALLAPLTFACLVLGYPLSAHAEPQANVGLTLGAAGVSKAPDIWSSTRLHLGAHGDVLFGRKSNDDFGIGPFAEVLTAFNDLQVGGGASALLPVHSYLPLVLSAGGYGRYARADGWEPGVSGQLFWGSRSYNYHGNYVLAGGLRLEFRQGLGASEERSVILAAHLDGQVLALPFVFLYEWIRGPRGD